MSIWTIRIKHICVRKMKVSKLLAKELVKMLLQFRCPSLPCQFETMIVSDTYSKALIVMSQNTAKYYKTNQKWAFGWSSWNQHDPFWIQWFWVWRNTTFDKSGTFRGTNEPGFKLKSRQKDNISPKCHYYFKSKPNPISKLKPYTKFNSAFEKQTQESEIR